MGRKTNRGNAKVTSSHEFNLPAAAQLTPWSNNLHNVFLMR
jgi:hypothetical protein